MSKEITISDHLEKQAKQIRWLRSSAVALCGRGVCSSDQLAEMLRCGDALSSLLFRISRDPAICAAIEAKGYAAPVILALIPDA